MRDRNLRGRGFLENSSIVSSVHELTQEANETSNWSNIEKPMKLIPWQDIWTTLKVARIRGNGEMIEVFYDTLFKEAVFDDHGAWSLDLKDRR
jgi:hypothetical protein